MRMYFYNIHVYFYCIFVFVCLFVSLFKSGNQFLPLEIKSTAQLKKKKIKRIVCIYYTLYQSTPGHFLFVSFLTTDNSSDSRDPECQWPVETNGPSKQIFLFVGK